MSFPDKDDPREAAGDHDATLLHDKDTDPYFPHWISGSLAHARQRRAAATSGAAVGEGAEVV